VVNIAHIGKVYTDEWGGDEAPGFSKTIGKAAQAPYLVCIIVSINGDLKRIFGGQKASRRFAEGSLRD
jgi:hypothetical protein